MNKTILDFAIKIIITAYWVSHKIYTTLKGTPSILLQQDKHQHRDE